MSNAEEKKQKEYKKILEALLKQPENKTCADCGTAAPRWASATLGVFLCMPCAGIHRKIGTHVTFVRSVTLDTWNETQIDTMQRMGNLRASRIYEARVPKNYPRPNPSDNISMEKWIRDKYELKRFYKEPTEETFSEPAPVEKKPEPVVTNQNLRRVPNQVQPNHQPQINAPLIGNLLDDPPKPVQRVAAQPPPVTHQHHQQPVQQPIQQQPSQVPSARQNILSLFDNGNSQAQYNHQYQQHPAGNQYTHQQLTPQQQLQMQQHLLMQQQQQQQQLSQLTPQQMQQYQQLQLQQQQLLLQQQQLQQQIMSQNPQLAAQYQQHYAQHAGINYQNAYPGVHAGHQQQVQHVNTQPAGAGHVPGHGPDDLLLKINNMGQERRRQEFAVFNS